MYDKLKAQLEKEISNVEQSVAFWKEQAGLQASSPVAGLAANRLENVEAQLKRLLSARAVLIDA